MYSLSTSLRLSRNSYSSLDLLEWAYCVGAAGRSSCLRCAQGSMACVKRENKMGPPSPSPTVLIWCRGTYRNGTVLVCILRTSISPNTCSIQHPGSIMDAFNPFPFIHNEDILAEDRRPRCHYFESGLVFFSSKLQALQFACSCPIHVLVPPSTSLLPCLHRVHRVRYPSEDRRLLASQREYLNAPLLALFHPS